MADPFREHWWREGWVLVLVFFAGIAVLVALAQWQRENLRSQEPDLVYGTFLGEGPVIQRRYPPPSRAIFVQLDDGTKKSFGYVYRDLNGCKIGSKVALLKRGLNLSLAKVVCPKLAEGKR